MQDADGKHGIVVAARLDVCDLTGTRPGVAGQHVECLGGLQSRDMRDAGVEQNVDDPAGTGADFSNTLSAQRLDVEQRAKEILQAFNAAVKAFVVTRSVALELRPEIVDGPSAARHWPKLSSRRTDDKEAADGDRLASARQAGRDPARRARR